MLMVARVLLGFLAGAMGAYLVFHYFGCSGTCPLSDSPLTVALLGGLVGMTASLP